MKKAMLFTVIGLLLVAVMSAAPCAYSQEKTELGWISIPRNMEFTGEDGNGPITVTIHQGDFRLLLSKDQDHYTMIIVSDEGAYAFDPKITEASAAQAEPKSSVNVIKKDGEDWVEIKALVGKIEAVSLLKCSK